jgi:two-component system nitrogen regulation response regulator NtrX
MALLQQYEWPGNIRELRNQIERLMIMVPGPVIDVQEAAMSIQGKAVSSTGASLAIGHSAGALFAKPYESLKDARNAFEKEYIGRKLREHHWNISRTAEDLQIERSHLHRKIKLLDVEMRPEG